jgi:hypothetical protein
LDLAIPYWVTRRPALLEDPTACFLAVFRNVSYTGPCKNASLASPETSVGRGVLLKLPSCSVILYENLAKLKIYMVNKNGKF